MRLTDKKQYHNYDMKPSILAAFSFFPLLAIMVYLGKIFIMGRHEEPLLSILTTHIILFYTIGYIVGVNHFRGIRSLPFWGYISVDVFLLCVFTGNVPEDLVLTFMQNLLLSIFTTLWLILGLYMMHKVIKSNMEQINLLQKRSKNSDDMDLTEWNHPDVVTFSATPGLFQQESVGKGGKH